MAICPHCNTKNQDNAIFCIHCRKPLPKRSRKPGDTKPIAERVPAWVTELLAKHKEYPGPLIGLESVEAAEAAEMPRLDRVTPKPAEHETGVSALLAQLAEEGAPPPAGDRLASSVEWGAYAKAAETEPPAPSIDDFLADLDITPPASFVPSEPAPVEPGRPDVDVPDWLTEGLTPPPPQSRPPAPPETELSHAEVPDWLTESSAGFAAPPSPTELESDLPLDEHDVPDWLSETVKLPSTGQPEPSPGPPPDIETELPDWLSGDLTTSPPSAEPESRSLAELPDWLDDLPPDEADTGLVEEPGAEFEAEIPDWISAIVPPTPNALEPEPQLEAQDAAAELSDWNVPDWIAAAQMTDEEEAEFAAVTPPPTQAGPDWLELEEIAPVEAPDVPDWLSSGVQPLPQPEPAAPLADDTAALDWLAELGAAGEGPQSSEPAWPGGADITAPDLKPPDTAWLVGGDQPTPPPLPPVEPTDVEETAKSRRPLRRLKPLTQPSPEQPAEPSPAGPPDWVAGLVPADFTDEPAGGEPELPPDWAADLAPSSVVSPAETVTPPPDWAKQLMPPDFEGLELKAPPPQPLHKLTSKPASGPAAPKPAADLPVPPADEFPPDEAETGEEIDWIAQFSHALPETREFDAATAELLPEPPAAADELLDERLDWLAGESEAESPPEPAAAAPDWLAEFAASVSAAAPEEDSEIPDWLAELPAPDSAEAVSFQPPTDAEIGRPDWLSELSGAAAAVEPETPDWSFELPETPEGEQLAADIGEEELEIPAWLGQSAASTPDTVPPPAEDELETPDRPAEFEQPPSVAAELTLASWAAESLDDADDKIPATISGAEEIETLPWLEEALESTGEVEAEADMPDWLAELHPAPAEAESWSELAAESEDLPAWLTEQPADSRPEAAAPSPPAAEPELDAPPWMSELEAASPAEAEEIPAWLAELPADAPEPEAALPDWLSALRPAPAKVEEAELPDWLSELPIAPAEIEQVVTPDQPAEAEIESLVMIDAEPAEPDLTAAAAVESPEELPDWLAELPPAPAETAEPDLPAWLAGPTETPAVDQPPAETEMKAEAEEPDWLGAGLAASLVMGAAAVVTADDESEAEAAGEGVKPAEEPVEWPDWLSEFREAPPAETEVAAEEQEIETPDWLAELPLSSTEAAETETPAWLAPTAEETVITAGETEPELETPDWLAELSDAAAEEVAAPSLPDQEPAESSLGLAPAPESDVVGLPDWLSQLRVVSAEETTTAEEMPDWLGESFPEPEVEAPSGEEKDRWAAGSAPLEWEQVEETELAEPFAQPQAIEEIEELPDWLVELPAIEADEEAAEAPETETVAPLTVAELLESPNWLADLTPAEAEMETGLPDWLAESAKIGATEAVVSQAELAEETPDWLIESSQPTAGTDEITTEPDVDLPPWLAELPAQPAEPVAMIAETEAEPDVGLPPWLAELPAQPAEPAEPTTMIAETEAEPGVDLPPWLAELPAQPAEPVAMMAETEAEPGVELPSWLAELPAQPAEPAEAAVIEERADETIARSSWLARLSAPLAAADEPPAELPSPELSFAAAAAEPVAPKATEAEVPDWLAELGEDAASEEELVIPDWLTGVAATETIVSSRWRESEPPLQPAGEAEQIEAEALEKAAAPTEATIPADQPLDFADEPHLPDWLTDSETTAVLPPLAKETAAPELVESKQADVSEPLAPLAPLAAETVESSLATPPAPAKQPKQPPAQVKATAAKAKTAKKKTSLVATTLQWLRRMMSR